MARKPHEIVACQICGRQKKASECVLGELVRESVAREISKRRPDWARSGYICREDVNFFRAEAVRAVLEAEKVEITSLEQDVVRGVTENEILSKNVETEFRRHLTFGERLADRVAAFGGSWTFIGIFSAIIIAWVAANSIALLSEPFDPYPYILLNLVLSTLAAMQAPIIIMSQNRQAERDRLRAQEDYKVNLKAELEIRHLNEKMDNMVSNQWQRLLEIQQIQTEILEELARKGAHGSEKK
ncbi:MAG: DUF1003 domain-containing protein [Methanobacteriota archaeon]